MDLFGPKPPSDLWDPNSKLPFSLGRVQMVFWTIIVLISFVYIFLASGEWNSLTASTVALLGISASTAVGARIADIDSDWTTKFKSALGESEHLTSQITQLQAAANAAGATPPAQLTADLNDAKSKRATVQQAIAALLAGKPQSIRPSENFWKDILRPNTAETSLHRLQLLIFTVTFAVIFLWYTAYEISMPEFSSTMLALLGISSATYVGFKFA
jgi:hypothetical protein